MSPEGKDERHASNVGKGDCQGAKSTDLPADEAKK